VQRLSVWTTEAIPKGTRFGPLIGRHDNVDVINLSLAMKSKHVWLVSYIFFAQANFIVLFRFRPRIKCRLTVFLFSTIPPQQLSLTPARGRYSIYPPRRDGRLSWPRTYLFHFKRLRHKKNFVHFQIFGVDGRPTYKVDGSDTSRANWMQAVSVAPRGGRRPNLWASQVDDVIFFYGVDAIPARTELVVGYCSQYSHLLYQAATLAGKWTSLFFHTDSVQRHKQMRKKS